MGWGIFRVVIFLIAFIAGLFIAAPKPGVIPFPFQAAPGSSVMVICGSGPVSITRAAAGNGYVRLNCSSNGMLLVKRKANPFPSSLSTFTSSGRKNSSIFLHQD